MGYTADSSCRLTWSAQKRPRVWVQKFHRTREGYLQFSRARYFRYLEIDGNQIRIHGLHCSEKSVDLCVPTSFRQTIRGLCLPWVNGEWLYGTRSDAVAKRWTTKVPANYKVLKIWEFLSQTTYKQGVNISFIKFLFAVLKLCVPCICINSCFINQHMHNVWRLHFSPYYTSTCFDE